ncbi:MAG: oligosaccharide repeat unit polymerase [Bacteroidales bacterium]|nr:oligosaccharide repeat unit polymerase [Bacteroidales bacterium]
MILAIVVLVVLLAAVIADNLADRSILYPPFVFNAIWFMVILIYVIFKFIDPGEMDTLHPKTLILVGISNIIFSLGGLYVRLQFRKKPSEIKFRPSAIPEIAGDLIIVLTIITLVLLWFRAREMASQVWAKNFFIALRHQLTNMRMTYGILDYFLVFGLFASLFRLYLFDNFRDLTFKRRVKLVISVLISFAFLALSTGRTYIFFYFITVFITLYLKGKFRSRYVTGFFLTALLTFVIVGIVLNKGGEFGESAGENLKLGLGHILAYFEGPVLALDRFVTSGFDHTFGKNTFRFFIAVLYETGLVNTPPVDIVKEWIFVPYPTNVFTVFQPYVMDFGIPGCWVIMFLLGLVHTWMFYRAKTSDNHFKMLTAYSYFPLLMVFFQDQYFSLLSFWIQLWFYSFILLFLFREYSPGKPKIA